jgi:hypothetical protein
MTIDLSQAQQIFEDFYSVVNSGDTHVNGYSRLPHPTERIKEAIQYLLLANETLFAQERISHVQYLKEKESLQRNYCQLSTFVYDNMAHLYSRFKAMIEQAEVTKGNEADILITVTNHGENYPDYLRAVEVKESAALRWLEFAKEIEEITLLIERQVRDSLNNK